MDTVLPDSVASERRMSANAIQDLFISAWALSTLVTGALAVLGPLYWAANLAVGYLAVAAVWFFTSSRRNRMCGQALYGGYYHPDSDGLLMNAGLAALWLFLSPFYPWLGS